LFIVVTVVVVLRVSDKSRLADRQPSVAVGCPGDNQAVRVPQVQNGGECPMRIAVASETTDGLNAHFGYAEHFLVFDIDDGGTCLVEIRAVSPHCTGTGGNRRLLRDSVDAVSDCVAVVASRIGPCARRALDAAGVLALEHEGPGLEGTEALIAALRRSRIVRARRQELQKESSR
jgi:predicted Fe-Mo cluster-binding NifX family protein